MLQIFVFMLLMSGLPAIQEVSADPAAQLYAKVKQAGRSGRFEELRALFVSPDYTKYLESMVGRADHLRSLGISGFVAPPGFEKFGDYWVVFHKYQRLQHDHDVVVPMVSTGDGLRLGSEIPEDIFVPYRIESLDFDVRLYPTDERAAFSTKATIKRIADGPKTVFMRMNDAYTVKAAKYNGKDVQIISNQPIGSYTLDSNASQLVQAGGVLYLTNAGDGGRLELEYFVTVDEPGCDQIVRNHALFTSYWYPHIGRQPAKSTTRIEGPANWLLLGPGNKTSESIQGNRKVVTFRNDVPVSWFHIVGGPYVLAYECEDRGRKFRAWHFGTVNLERGKHDAEMARDSVAFFEDRFGKFPYEGYDIVDTPEFYGVECYSFTVLSPRITSWATSHEVGHTWFGGLVPNTYIRSIWNESITQYVDSVQFKKNSDSTLENGYAARKVNVSLTDSFLPHGPYGNVGYFRGAYTMKMLENEIGFETMNRCLRKLVAQRFGVATEWWDIEKVFIQASGRDLEWFWNQWIRGSVFPSVSIKNVLTEPGPVSGYNTNVRLTQSGTKSPYRIRFVIVLKTPSGDKRFQVIMTETEQAFNLETVDKPYRIEFDPTGWTLADMPEPRDF